MSEEKRILVKNLIVLFPRSFKKKNDIGGNRKE